MESKWGFTLIEFKLSMSNVNKCKILAMGYCNIEIILSFTDILNSGGKEETNQQTQQKHIMEECMFTFLADYKQLYQQCK